MKKQIYTGAILLSIILVSFASSCQKELLYESEMPATRAYGDKSPKAVACIEVNDTDPRNTTLYRMNDEPFFDIVLIFAANIHASGSEPCLYLNDNVTEMLVPTSDSTITGHLKYIQPLQDDGTKVLLSILGDWQGVGVGNLTEENQQKFAEILAWAVEEYDLDGIDFDDEWAQYGDNSNFPTLVNGSFSGLVTKLRIELDERFPNEHKLICAYDIGNAYTLTSEAVDAMDFGWYSYLSANSMVYPSSPWTNSKWSAQALPLNVSYNIIMLNLIKNRSLQSKNGGMGAIQTYDLRLHTEQDPLPVLQKIAEGAYDNAIVSRDSIPSNGYPKSWTSGGPGTTITHDDILQDGFEDPGTENPDPEDPDIENPDNEDPQIPDHPGFDMDRKIPSIVGTIDVDDTNPLNIGSYDLYSANRALFDICNIEEAKIYADEYSPTLYFTSGVNSVLSDPGQYVRPLQEKNIRVLLTVSGGNQGVGVGNLNNNQAEELAEILAYVVEYYGLDGIDFNDQNASYGSNNYFSPSVDGSFSTLITKLRSKFDARFPNEHKLITVHNIGYSSTISAIALSGIDYMYYMYYSSNSYVYPTDLPNSRWSAQAIYLNAAYNPITLTQINNRSAQSRVDGMGAIFTKDLRIKTEQDPLPALLKIGNGAFLDSVTYNGNAYSKNWTGVSRIISSSDIND